MLSQIYPGGSTAQAQIIRLSVLYQIPTCERTAVAPARPGRR